MKENKRKKKLTPTTLVGILIIAIVVLFFANLIQTTPKPASTDLKDENQVAVFVTLNPKSENFDQNVIIFDIENNQSQKTALEKISIEIAGDQEIGINLFRDENKNKLLDNNDYEFVNIDIKRNKNNIEFLNIKEFIEKEAVNSKSKRYFIKSTQSLSPSKIDFRFIDLISGQRFKPYILRFVDEETIKDLYN